MSEVSEGCIILTKPSRNTYPNLLLRSSYALGVVAIITGMFSLDSLEETEQTVHSCTLFHGRYSFVGSGL